MNFFDPLSLRLFISICEQQSLSGAAEREHLTVSAVSKRLTALEQQVGASLLERGRGAVQLTPAGEALLPAARGLLQSMAHIQAKLSEYAQSVPGQVRVVATPSALTAALPSDLAAFLEHHPSVSVSLEERLATELVQNIEDGRADLGICWDQSGLRKLQTAPYRNDHLVVIAHRKHELARYARVSFRDTLPYERVTVDMASIVQHKEQRLAIAEGRALKSSIVVKTYDTACRIAAARLAIALVPRESCAPLVRALGLKAIALSDDWAHRHFVVCMRERAELNVPARLLLESLSAHGYASSAQTAS